MTMTKYDRALTETQSVLDEWLAGYGDRILVLPLAQAIVERLIAKGVIQSIDEDDLRAVRTGPLAPGRIVVGGEEVDDANQAQA